MNYKFLISKIMYNLYDQPKYPKFIRIISSNNDYTKFRYIYNKNNVIYKNEIDIENLFRWFNVLKPELVISIKKINNRLMLVLNRYRGEDENLSRDIGYMIDLIETKNQKRLCGTYIEYIYLEYDNSIKFDNNQTNKIRYIYYFDDIKTILNDLVMDQQIIKYILIPIYEYISKVLHLYTIDNENAIKNILYLNDSGKEFLLFITNKIIDFRSVNIFVYDCKCNVKKFLNLCNFLLIKYKNVVYIITFKEKRVLERSEIESGFTSDEMSIFLQRKI